MEGDRANLSSWRRHWAEDVRLRATGSGGGNERHEERRVQVQSRAREQRNAAGEVTEGHVGLNGRASRTASGTSTQGLRVVREHTAHAVALVGAATEPTED